MKKRSGLALVAAVAAVIVASCLFGLTGCRKKAESVDYAGRYVMSEVVIGDNVLDSEELALNYPPKDNYVEIIDSERVICVITGSRIETTYSREGDVLHVSDPSGTVDFFFENGRLAFFDEGSNQTIYFTKTE